MFENLLCRRGVRKTRSAHCGKRARACRLSLEPLETRLAPAGGLNTFARLAGEIATPTERDTIAVQVRTEDFMRPGSGRVLLGFAAHAADGSTLNPGAIRVIPQRPAAALTLLNKANTAGDPASLTLARVTPGAFNIRFASQRATAGAYHLDVFLAGDANSDFQVNQADLDLIRSQIGRAHV